MSIQANINNSKISIEELKKETAKINLVAEINRIKEQENIIILAHYYQNSTIQDLADFIGDSLDLSRKASNNKAQKILFCGVKFMAEVAKILSPEKDVLIPDFNAGCSLESSCPPKQFQIFKNRYPQAIVISYINCSAKIKAMSDIIVTSSNAEKIINQIPPEQQIIFAPDQHLGRYLTKKANRELILWNGSCMVHEQFSEKELIRLSVAHPNALIIAHPECPEHLLNYANHIGSTSSLLQFTKDHQGKEFIVLTEPQILHQMKKGNPDGKFYDCKFIDSAGCTLCNNCPHMQLNNIEKIYAVLKYGNNSPFGGLIELSDQEIADAKKPLLKMLEMSN